MVAANKIFRHLALVFVICFISAESSEDPFWGFANVTSGDENCPVGYTLVGSQCLMFVTFAAQSHIDARRMCHSASGELLAITMPTQFVHVVNYIHSYGYTGRYFWLDGSDATEEGNWVTSSGQPIPRGTPFWAATQDFQEPNNFNGQEHCIEINAYEYYYFNDAPCSLESNFICQYKPQNQDSRESSTAEVLKASETEDSGSRCPILYVEVGGLCLLFMTWAELTWNDARHSCGDSSDLLAITDAEVLRAICLYLHQENIAGHSFWLGGSDSEEGKWFFTTSEPVPMGTPFWGLSSGDPSFIQEPNGGYEENCLALESLGFHYFRDVSCSSKLNPLCVYQG
ncbi:macrophage mannose receptor 1-like [Penaeus monodon]|uniref:macrophage mannose receptor 1-like n=1 Tax=Penaeus monodon TaxID=6687 RepID=UPI0018A718B8|nr:macrophage mannose receptor 1-like [Penaeus monodon]